MMTISFCIGLGLIKIDNNNSKFIFCDFPALTSGRGELQTKNKKIVKIQKNEKELSQSKAAIKQRAYRLRQKLKKQLQEVKINERT